MKAIEEYEESAEYISASEEFGKLNYVKRDLVMLKSEIFRRKPDYDIRTDGFLDENGFIWKRNGNKLLKNFKEIKIYRKQSKFNIVKI